MILPEKRFHELRIMRACPDGQLRGGPVHVHAFYLFGLYCYYVLCIERIFWSQLPSFVKWFVVFHESFHLIQQQSYDSSIPHESNTLEWEADIYAARICYLAGFSLNLFAEDLKKYAGRNLYLPFT